MIAEEELAQTRREEYEEQYRVLLSRAMSEKGGILTKGFTAEEIEAKALNYFKDLLVLQTKYIDVVRENWGFARDDDSATFGDDLSCRWQHFVKNHLVKDEEGKEISCMYEDKDGKYRLIPDTCPSIEQMQFIMKNYDKLFVDEDDSVEIEMKPSICIRGVEAIPWSKNLDYYLPPSHEDFYLRQVMILIAELLDVVDKNKVHLKEEKQDELFKVLAEKVKKIF